MIARADEDLPGSPLLRLVMRDGQRLPEGDVDLEKARQYTRDQLRRLPQTLLALSPADPSYPVQVSEALRVYQDQVTQEVTQGAQALACQS